MKTMFIEDHVLVSADGNEIWNKISTAVEDIFKMFPDYAPHEVSHMISSSAYTSECERRLMFGLAKRKAARLAVIKERDEARGGK